MSRRLPFSVIVTLDDRRFCWVWHSEASSAFNILALVVAFLTLLLIWKLFDMWCQSAPGFLVVSMDGMFFMNQGSARWCGSWDSIPCVGWWELCGQAVLFFSLSLYEQQALVQWWIGHDSCPNCRPLFAFFMCLLHYLWAGTTLWLSFRRKFVWL